jgi:hypothetical protein
MSEFEMVEWGIIKDKDRQKYQAMSIFKYLMENYSSDGLFPIRESDQMFVKNEVDLRFKQMNFKLLTNLIKGECKFLNEPGDDPNDKEQQFIADMTSLTKTLCLLIRGSVIFNDYNRKKTQSIVIQYIINTCSTYINEEELLQDLNKVLLGGKKTRRRNKRAYKKTRRRAKSRNRKRNTKKK